MLSVITSDVRFRAIADSDPTVRAEQAAGIAQLVRDARAINRRNGVAVPLSTTIENALRVLTSSPEVLTQVRDVGHAWSQRAATYAARNAPGAPPSSTPAPPRCTGPAGHARPHTCPAHPAPAQPVTRSDKGARRPARPPVADHRDPRLREADALERDGMHFRAADLRNEVAQAAHRQLQDTTDLINARNERTYDALARQFGPDAAMRIIRNGGYDVE